MLFGSIQEEEGTRNFFKNFWQSFFFLLLNPLDCFQREKEGKTHFPHLSRILQESVTLDAPKKERTYEYHKANCTTTAPQPRRATFGQKFCRRFLVH